MNITDLQAALAPFPATDEVFADNKLVTGVSSSPTTGRVDLLAPTPPGSTPPPSPHTSLLHRIKDMLNKEL